jgi:hypothetical protein
MGKARLCTVASEMYKKRKTTWDLYKYMGKLKFLTIKPGGT